jgi:hypothetical protein
MQQPAPRSKAARKRGVQAEGLRTLARVSTAYYSGHGCTTWGFRRYSLLLKSITNMSVGFMSSFCTPLGAMYILSSWRMLVPPPVPVTWRQLHVSHGLSYNIFFARHSPRGLVVPSLGCRTLRRVCKCGWPDGWHRPSAQVPPHLQYSSPFLVVSCTS